jgi:rhodanese-related sulfurtransferase
MKKITILALILLSLLTPCAISVNEYLYDNASCSYHSNGIINITVWEVWDILESEDDGIQIPVDDRTFQEYFTERIATPHSYDKPILYPLQLIEQPFFMKLFFFLFEDKEIIIYCRSANRSYIAGNLLFENGYQGVVYNMVGGINAWKAAGLPTVKGFGIDNSINVVKT